MRGEDPETVPFVPSKGGQNDQPEPSGGLEETLQRLTVPSPHLRGPRKLGPVVPGLGPPGVSLAGKGVAPAQAAGREWGAGVCSHFQAPAAARECPSLFIAGCQTAAALVHSRRIPASPRPPQPQAALPQQPSECLLTHPEKASIMARRLPPPEEFRGAGPAGR